MKKYEANARRDAIRILQERGYEVQDVSAGTGVPKLSRLLLKKDGNQSVCIVKYTSTGRIHFVYDNGIFKTLEDADLVLHVHGSKSAEDPILMSLFEQSTVRRAFQEAHSALKKADQDHLPIWLNPEFEEGLRFTGSGFKDKAVWAEKVQPTLIKADDYANEGVVESVESQAKSHAVEYERDEELGIMDRIKVMLSEHMGVRPDQLEVDVRVRL